MEDDLNIKVEKAMADVLGFNRFEHATVGVLYILFCIVGVTSNFLMAVAFYKDTRLVTTSKPWLHILLALANIGVVAPSPFPASSSFSGKWLYGNTMCQFYAFEGMFVGITAITTVVALCVERYFVGNRKIATDKSGWFYIWTAAIIIGNALFWATMPLLGWSRYAIEYTGTSCALDWKDPDEGFVSYVMTLQIFSFGIPLALAAWCLCFANSQPNPVASGSRDAAQVSEMPDQTSDGFSEDQLTKLCYVFLVLIGMGWGPFAFLVTSTTFVGSQGLSMLAATIPPLACKLMTSAYPLAYAVANPRFRRSITAIFSGHEQRKEN